MKQSLSNNHLLKKVKTAIDTHAMLVTNDRVLVGVSGGPDSVALLHVLFRLAPELNIKLGVAHLDHQLRKPTSAQEARFVASLCAELGLPFFHQAVDVQTLQRRERCSLETAGRRARYRFYYQTARSHAFSKIALGHHADDTAELVLMNLLRGSGPLGMAGIPPVRDDIVIRPMIHVRRTMIMQFLTQNELEYVWDEANQDPRFVRNRIRHHLIPELKRTYNPNLTAALNRLASIARLEEDWLDICGKRILGRIAQTGHRRLSLSVTKLRRNHPALQRRILRLAVKQIKGDLRRITFEHIDTILNRLPEGAGRAGCHLPDGIHIDHTGDILSISKQDSRSKHAKATLPPSPLYIYTIVRPDTGPRVQLIESLHTRLVFSALKSEDIPDMTSAGHETAFFDMDKLHFPLVLRNFQPGDRFIPLGMSGSQKVKKFFINNKVPRERRREIPVLISAGTIVWVVGHRINETVKITPATRYVLKGELLLA